MLSSTGTAGQFQFGSSSLGDVPAQADFDGDGKTDPTLYRKSTGTWYIKRSSDSQTAVQAFGLPTDVPFPADHDGDGKADIAVWRNGTRIFYSLNSSDQALQTVSMDPHSGTPVSSDYDGDGKADYAVRTGAVWVISKSSDGLVYSQAPSGDIATDIAVPNDYDGDGKTDIAVWRAIESSPGAGDVGYWYIRQSASGTLRTVRWGISNDIPVPALYRR